MFDFFYKRSRNSRIFATMLRFLYGCDIPPHTKIGGVRFNHRGLGTVIHPASIIDENVWIEHHVCLGQKTGQSVGPHICRDVVIGCYSIILGDVTVGEGSIIGAGSVVTHDIPAGVIYTNKRIESMRENNKSFHSY